MFGIPTFSGGFSGSFILRDEDLSRGNIGAVEELQAYYFLSPVDCNSCMQIPVTADMCPFSWNIYAEEGVLHVL
jgi:hypothetical protein